MESTSKCNHSAKQFNIFNRKLNLNSPYFCCYAFSVGFYKFNNETFLTSESSKMILSDFLVFLGGLDNCIGIRFSLLLTSQIGRNSSSDCLDVMEYTRMKAWPLDIDNLCIAGNWCEPVVSVISKLHIFLLLFITWNSKDMNVSK